MQAHCDGFIRGTAKEGGERAIWTGHRDGRDRRPGTPNEGLKVRAQPPSLGIHGLVEGTGHKLSLSLLPKCECGTDQKPGPTAWEVCSAEPVLGHRPALRTRWTRRPRFTLQPLVLQRVKVRNCSFSVLGPRPSRAPGSVRGVSLSSAIHSLCLPLAGQQWNADSRATPALQVQHLRALLALLWSLPWVVRIT